MQAFLYKFFYKETNDVFEGGLVNIPKDRKDWPENWKKTEYKKNKLFNPILLPDFESIFFKFSAKRSSDINNIFKKQISVVSISKILKCAYGEVGDSKTKHRNIPSGGARYPLELYVVFFNEQKDLDSGSYHYNVEDHSLEPIQLRSFSKEEIQQNHFYEWVTNANGVFIVTSVFDRSTRKYGSRGYIYSLLEAGHLAQNLTLAALEDNITVRPLGASNVQNISDLICVDLSVEGPIYYIVF